MKRPAVLLATLLLTAACGKDAGESDTASASATTAAASAPASTGDDLQDISNYRLSMDKIDKFYEAQKSFAIAASKMSPAERAALEAKDEADDSSDESLDDLARKFESHPAAREGLREAGISGREYALLTMSVFQTGMAAAVLEMRPNENQDSLAREMKANPANLKWWKENQAELTRRQNAFEAEMKRLGLDPKGDRTN